MSKKSYTPLSSVYYLFPALWFVVAIFYNWSIFRALFSLSHQSPMVPLLAALLLVANFLPIFLLPRRKGAGFAASYTAVIASTFLVSMSYGLFIPHWLAGYLPKALMWLPLLMSNFAFLIYLVWLRRYTQFVKRESTTKTECAPAE
jgi:hypothetical protein